MNTFDWSDLAFGSKKEINALQATFIAAPRELSKARFTQLVKTYLPKGNIVIGIAKEEYVYGFEGQPQFRMLQLDTVKTIVDKVNSSKTPYKIYPLVYSQRDTLHLLEKLRFNHLVFVNGSWKFAFHTRDTFYTIAKQHLTYDLVSPFTDEHEAMAYEAERQKLIDETLAEHAVANRKNRTLSAAAMLAAAQDSAKRSYDYGFQTGVSLGRITKQADEFEFLAAAFNKVVPYQTYAMHFGAARETHFSPPNDLNHYDAVHAEVELLIACQKNKIDLHDTTLFINLLPCPTCARMIADTDITEVVYREDHSSGYAVALLEKAQKTVRRIVADTI